VGGLPIWESSPLIKHQRAIDRIRASITAVAPSTGRCACIHLADVYVSFPDGSLKRPDVAIFCEEPEDDDEPIKTIPEAVIEVISKGYEAKDLEVAPRFYLSHGVKDLVVFDPYTLVVLHVRRDGVQRLISPVQIKLECGCLCTV
jgi:Uma2 family endonuclease